MKRRTLVLASVVVALFAAVGLGYQLRIWTAPRSPQESVGERLRRECSSIIDAAGELKVTQAEVVWVLEEDPAIAAELRSKGKQFFSQKFDALVGHPAWDAGLQEAIWRKQEKMINDCVPKRGLAGR